MQNDSVKTLFEKKFYELVGQVYEQGFNSDRFDRLDDYSKTVAVVPTSAKTGEGIPEYVYLQNLAKIDDNPKPLLERAERSEKLYNENLKNYKKAEKEFRDYVRSLQTPTEDFSDYLNTTTINTNVQTTPIVEEQMISPEDALTPPAPDINPLQQHFDQNQMLKDAV